jgi:hypothetical protein
MGLDAIQSGCHPLHNMTGTSQCKKARTSLVRNTRTAEVDHSRFLDSFNVVHMPQGCGWVVSISLHITVNIQRNPLQDLARNMGEWRPLASRGKRFLCFFVGLLA